MKDSFGREINYLRISLTDRCNLRCSYCMPEIGIKNKVEHQDILTLEEVFEITKVFVASGVTKIRLTGGEPLVRKGIVCLIKRISGLPGVEEITMTTNGILLAEYAKDLKEAGLNRLNISLDTLNAEKFKKITGGGDLDKVLEGIKAARENDLTPIKINTVLMKGFNENEIMDFVELTKDHDMDVRFIELMPIGGGIGFANDKYLSGEKVLESAKELVKVPSTDAASPSTYYRYPEAKGRVGLINPISCKFCVNCNRVRLTSTGGVKMCLHSNREIDLKSAIRNGENLEKIIRNAILSKDEEHHLEKKEYLIKSMNEIGG